MNKMVRKQFFITAEQNKRLKAHAAAAGVSEAELVRAGIDLRLERKPEKADWRRLAPELLRLLGRARKPGRGNARDSAALEPARSNAWGGKRSAHR